MDVCTRVTFVQIFIIYTEGLNAITFRLILSEFTMKLLSICEAPNPIAGGGL